MIDPPVNIDLIKKGTPPHVEPYLLRLIFSYKLINRCAFESLQIEGYRDATHIRNKWLWIFKPCSKYKETTRYAGNERVVMRGTYTLIRILSILTEQIPSRRMRNEL